MGYGEWTTDQLEEELISNRALRSRLAAVDLAILEELDSRQVATGDGCRSLSEWTASRLDVSLETAKSLVRTLRRTSHRPELREGLASGVSFDRIEALSRIPEPLGRSEHLDIAGVRREAVLRARISTETEARTAADQYLILQPSLDESWWKLWGGLDGYSGAIVDKALNECPISYPPSPTGAEAPAHGGKPPPSPHSASQTTRHQPRSPSSSTPNTP